jgi:ATP-dependent Clp protease ATP-binding subunit ClpA
MRGVWPEGEDHVTDERARKQAIRRRMQQTGEKYTEARRALEHEAAGSQSEVERFSQEARQVIVRAQEEARNLKHGRVDTEHLLLGLLHETDGVAARVLRGRAVTAERARAEILRRVASGEETTSGTIPFTRRAKKVLERALLEALGLAQNSITGEHLLLALAAEPEGVAAAVLSDLGADAEMLRSEVIKVRTGHGAGFVPATATTEAAGALERFTERARAVCDLAKEEARDLGHTSVVDEHLLLGLLRVPDGLAALALQPSGVTLDEARAAATRQHEASVALTSGHVRFTKSARQVLERALREALSLGHNYIGTEHILLGLLGKDEGGANHVLHVLGANPQEIRKTVLRMLRSPRHQSEEVREPWWSIALTAASSSQDLELFRKQVRATRRLTAQEEVDLAGRIVLGDPEAKQQLVEANLHLVTSLADEYHTQDPPLLDLIKAGTHGLVHAAEAFNPREGLRFSRHATHQIRQAIVEALPDHTG